MINERENDLIKMVRNKSNNAIKAIKQRDMKKFSENTYKIEGIYEATCNIKGRETELAKKIKEMHSEIILILNRNR